MEDNGVKKDTNIKLLFLISFNQLMGLDVETYRHFTFYEAKVYSGINLGYHFRKAFNSHNYTVQP